jgi:hypothetical protein
MKYVQLFLNVSCIFLSVACKGRSFNNQGAESSSFKSPSCESKLSKIKNLFNKKEYTPDMLQIAKDLRSCADFCYLKENDEKSPKWAVCDEYALVVQQISLASNDYSNSRTVKSFDTYRQMLTNSSDDFNHIVISIMDKYPLKTDQIDYGILWKIGGLCQKLRDYCYGAALRGTECKYQTTVDRCEKYAK